MMAEVISNSGKRYLNKSTIVRFIIEPTVRLVLGTSSRLWPEATAFGAEWLFRTPPRRRPWREEDAWMEDVEFYDVPCGAHRLHVWARGAGPAVLLVHGWGGRGSQLGALIGPLVEQGYRVVGFDAPGHGQSSGRQSSLVEMAQAIDELARQVGGLHGLVAHSAGAAATTLALHQAGLPVDRLVYLAPGVSPEDFVDYFTSRLGLTSGIGDRIQERLERRFDIDFADLNSLTVAPKMRIPLCVLHDPADRETAFTASQALVNHWPGASLVELTGVGHFRILRAPQTLAAVQAFFGSPEAARQQRIPARIGAA